MSCYTNFTKFKSCWNSDRSAFCKMNLKFELFKTMNVQKLAGIKLLSLDMEESVRPTPMVTIYNKFWLILIIVHIYSRFSNFKSLKYAFYQFRVLPNLKIDNSYFKRNKEICWFEICISIFIVYKYNALLSDSFYKQNKQRYPNLPCFGPQNYNNNNIYVKYEREQS